MNKITNYKKILQYYFIKLSYNPFLLGLTLAFIFRLTVVESFNRLGIFVISIFLTTMFLILGIIKYRQKNLFIFFISLSIGFISAISFSQKPAWSGLPLEKITTYSGYTTGDSRKTSSGKYLFELKLQRVKTEKGQLADAGGSVIVFSKKDPRVFKGEYIEIKSSLNASDEYLFVMKKQKVGKYSFLKNPPCFFSYLKADDIIKTNWKSVVYEKRAVLMKKIIFRSMKLQSGSGGLFIALFTGNRDGLSMLENEVFRKSGCSHILALSGMHLGIISGIILFLLKPIPGRKTGFFITNILIFFYLILTGFGISLTRAAVMYFIGGIVYVFYRKFRVFDVLCLSFITLIFIDPSCFFSLSFQLSFSAVLGIIVISPVFERLLRPYLPNWLALSLSCSFGAQLFVIPFLINYFGEFYPIGLFSGLIVAPLVTIFIWFGILHLFTAFSLFSALEGYLYRFIFFLAKKMSTFPSAGENISVELSIVFSISLILLIAVYCIYRRMIDGIPNKL